MNRKDQHKVWNAGFQIIRRSEHQQKIKVLRPKKGLSDKPRHEIKPMQLSWQELLGPFDSKAAMNRKADDLLSLTTVIED